MRLKPVPDALVAPRGPVNVLFLAQIVPSRMTSVRIFFRGRHAKDNQTKWRRKLPP